MLEEVGSELDLGRVHFLGKVQYQTYLDLLSVSLVHTYWTTPFVLSWSFLEAAANGVPLVASDTAPIREFASGIDCSILPFFNSSEFSRILTTRLEQKTPRSPAHVLEEIDLQHCLRLQKKFLKI